jgi:hypothetical protein
LFEENKEPSPTQAPGSRERAKGNRNEIEGKYFSGIGDRFMCDGRSMILDLPFWRAGRYMMVTIDTKEASLELLHLDIEDTRYPFSIAGHIRCDAPEVHALIDKSVRTLSACSHDGWIDPYYEQMMWAGDGLQNMLAYFCVSPDTRLAAKWLRTLFGARLPNGFRCARYPAKDRLLIAPYSLYLVQGLKEYAFWRDDPDLVRKLMPGAREILQTFENYLTRDGVLGPLPGWNFVDWAPEWDAGIPPGADTGESAILHWHFVYTCRIMAELEEAFDEHEMAARHRRTAERCAEAGVKKYWRPNENLFADDIHGTSYSEHAQTFAILSGFLPPEIEDATAQSLIKTPGLHRATMSFSHHLFECFAKLGRTDIIFERLAPWFETDSLGLLTLPEAPEPSRSDCHAWSTHPVYHLAACRS